MGLGDENETLYPNRSRPTRRATAVWALAHGLVLCLLDSLGLRALLTPPPPRLLRRFPAFLSAACFGVGSYFSRSALPASAIDLFRLGPFSPAFDLLAALRFPGDGPGVADSADRKDTPRSEHTNGQGSEKDFSRRQTLKRDGSY